MNFNKFRKWAHEKLVYGQPPSSLDNDAYYNKCTEKYRTPTSKKDEMKE